MVNAQPNGKGMTNFNCDHAILHFTQFIEKANELFLKCQMAVAAVGPAFRFRPQSDLFHDVGRLRVAGVATTNGELFDPAEAHPLNNFHRPALAWGKGAPCHFVSHSESKTVW